MFLGDSINAAVSELWQLAMTLASLKYIAGMVRQEVDTISASTGHEQDNKQSTESHRPSHVDKKEAHSNKGFAKNEEIEPAAFISSVVSHSVPFQDTSTEPEETQFNTSMVAHYQSNTEENCVEHEDDVLSMVCHQTTIHFQMKECQADPMVPLVTDCMEDEEIVQTFLPSMVSHQLAAVATPAELSELPVSMSAHVISTNGEEDGDNMIETSQKNSMMVHQITTEDMLVEQDVSASLYNVIKEDINGNYEMNSEQELEVYDESRIVTNSIEEKLVEENVIEEVCVSIQMDDEENSLQIETGFILSMYTHQLPILETPIENTKYLVSMAVHSCYTCTMEDKEIGVESDFETDPGMICSMVSHQVIMEDKSLENTITDKLTEKYLELSEPRDLESMDIKQQPFPSSMVAHQLPFLETPAEFSELLVSTASHGYLTFKDEEENGMIESYFEMDPGMLSSMVSHQVFIEDRSIENVCADELTENNLELIEPIDNESMDEDQLPFSNSIVAHQLPFLETPVEFSEFLASTASYGCLSFKDENIMEDICFETDPGIICSMVSHQVIMEDKSIENIVTDKLIENYLEMSKPIDHKGMKVKQLPFPSSMVAHQLPFLETPAEFSEFLVSAASHGHFSLKDEDSMIESSWEMDPGMLISMMSHQVFIEDRRMENSYTEELPENTLKLSEPNDHERMDVNQLPFHSSFIAHQLPFLETPVEFSEFMVSAASHGYLSFKDDSIMEDNGFETDPGMIYSMVSHQAGMEENDVGVFTEDLKDKTLQSSETIDYETIYIHQLPLHSSMVSHQLPFVETPTEYSQFLVSTTSHGCLPNIHHGDDDKSDAGLLTSMVAHHQIIEADNVNHDFKIMSSKGNVELSYELPQCLKEKECHTNLEVSNQKLDPHSDEESQCANISMVTHQLTVVDIPTQLSEYIISAVKKGSISTHSDYFVESGLMDSMVAHQTTDIRSTNVEDDTGVIQVYTSYVEETEHMPKCLNTEDVKNEYTTLKKDEIHKLQEDPESEMDSKIRGNESKPEEETHLTSLISHQLPFLSTCDQSEYTDCITSMVYHLDMSTAYQDAENIQLENNKCLVSMVTHTALNESCKDDKNSLEKTAAKTSSDVSSIPDNQILLNINAMEAETNISELVENNDNSYTDSSQPNENTKEAPQSIDTNSKNCLDKRPVGIEEDEEISESCDNFVNAAQNTYNDSVAEAYNSKLTKIQELQRLVENEIGEFEDKRKNNNMMIENNVQATETLIVNNVKEIEFKSCIAIHQQFNAESDTENNEDNFSDNESIYSSIESINSVIFASSDVITNHDEQIKHKDTFSSRRTSELNNSVENMIQATCTIEDNKPVIITTNQIQTEGLGFQDESKEEEMEQEREQIIESDNNQKEENYHYELGQNLELDDQEEKNKNNEDFNDLKMHLRKMPRKCSNIETKIREKELLSSLFKKSSKQAVEDKEQEKSQKKSQEKHQKSSMTIATLNENVKKETFKIRFKVRLNADSSKSSVLKYLFGCFGGEKYFHQTQ